MSAAFDTFDITVAQVPAGNALTIGWDNFSLGGTPVDASLSDVLSITTTVFTTILDDESFVGESFEGATLEASGGTLISSYLQTGLNNVLKKTYTIEVVFTLTDSSNTVVTQQAYGRVTKSASLLDRAQLSVTSVGDNTTNISFGIYPDTSVNWSSVFAFETLNIPDFLNDDGTYDVSGVSLRWVANPGPDQVLAGNPVLTGLVPLTGDGTILDNNGFTIVDPSFTNGVTYELGVSLVNNGVYSGSAGTVRSTTVSVTPTNKPEPPTDIVTVSTYEYNRYNTVNQYNVTSASTVTVLFDTPVGQDPSTNYYTIYRTDLSSNGYTPLALTSTAIGQVNAGSTGSYSYGGYDYSYSFIDTSAVVVPGSFFGYQITGSNTYGEGVPSTPLQGVRDGSKATAPVIANPAAGSNTLTLSITPPSSKGGFDFAGTYTVVYAGPTASDASGTLTNKTSPVTISGLTNITTYSAYAYAEMSNSNYTINYDVSGGLNGTAIQYYSTVSNTVYGTPYSSPTAPTSVAVQPDFSGSIPQGHSVVSWIADTSYNGNWVSFQIQRLDASGANPLPDASNCYIYTTPRLDSSLNPIGPAPQTKLDLSVDKGTTYTYAVNSLYTVGSQIVVSTATTSSGTTYQQYYDPSLNAGQILPFIAPVSPTATYSFDVSSQFLFNITPELSGVSETGGLPNVYYHAIVDVSGGARVFDADVSANVVNTIQISPNSYVDLTVRAYTKGPNAPGGSQVSYNSSNQVYSGLGPSILPPIITGYAIDNSGILHITTNNKGSALNFAEGLILDNSGTLLVSYSTNPSAPTSTNTYPDTTVFSVVSNTNSGSVIDVNFNDPQVTSVSGRLVVVSNAAGADVYNNI